MNQKTIATLGKWANYKVYRGLNIKRASYVNSRCIQALNIHT